MMPVKVAVVTGGHPFDVPNFHGLFRRLEGVDAYIQHMDDFASSSDEVRQSYGVVLFYHMLKETPKDEGQPWYAGKPRAVLEALGRSDQGIVMLHHAILAYRDWPLWDEMVGITGRKFGYFPAQSLRVTIDRADHPIIAGLAPWDMIDETYTMNDAGKDSDILLSVDHPNSMKHIAWTRMFRKSRIFCFESGHDNATWQTPNFVEVLRRGILWCARRI